MLHLLLFQPEFRASFLFLSHFVRCLSLSFSRCLPDKQRPASINDQFAFDGILIALSSLSSLLGTALLPLLTCCCNVRRCCCQHTQDKNIFLPFCHNTAIVAEVAVVVVGVFVVVVVAVAVVVVVVVVSVVGAVRRVSCCQRRQPV